MNGHIGAYLGEEFDEPGQGIVNCVESTGRWEDGIQFSYIYRDGARSWCKGAKVVGYWEAHGLASKWVVYTDDETQAVVEKDKKTAAHEVQRQHYDTSASTFFVADCGLRIAIFCSSARVFSSKLNFSPVKYKARILEILNDLDIPVSLSAQRI